MQRNKDEKVGKKKDSSKTPKKKSLGESGSRPEKSKLDQHVFIVEGNASDPLVSIVCVDMGKKKGR